MTFWTHELLDALRQIGDPLLDELGKDGTPEWHHKNYAPAAKDEPTERDGKQVPEQIRLLRTWRRSPNGAQPTEVEAKDKYWTDPGTPIPARQLEIAHSLFAAYGGEIGASLLLASIPNAYAAAAGASVLAQTGELSSNARRRIGETARLVLEVLFPETDRRKELLGKEAFAPIAALPPTSRGYRRVRTTRLTHAVIRELLNPVGGSWNAGEGGMVPLRPETLRGVPINQEDLIGTLGTFTVTTFEVMEKLGVPWNAEAELAYLMLWDRVGELLGIGTPEVWDQLPEEFKKENPDVRPLRPQSLAEARTLQDLIRERVWPLPVRGERPGPFDNKNGKVLARALLDELQEAMPRGLLRLPLVVMRYLVHPTAHELLGLGGGGLPDSLMRWPSVERFTRGEAHRPGKDLVERSMRVAATDISRRAFIHFIRTWDLPAEETSSLPGVRRDLLAEEMSSFPGVSLADTLISKGRGGISPA